MDIGIIGLGGRTPSWTERGLDHVTKIGVLISQIHPRRQTSIRFLFVSVRRQNLVAAPLFGFVHTSKENGIDQWEESQEDGADMHVTESLTNKMEEKRVLTRLNSWSLSSWSAVLPWLGNSTYSRFRPSGKLLSQNKSGTHRACMLTHDVWCDDTQGNTCRSSIIWFRIVRGPCP